MGGFEAAEMKSDSAVAEFAGEEENPIPTPPSPVEDMLVDIEETAEKLFFSDEDDAFPLLADFPCLSSPSASPSLSSAASIHSKHVPHLSTKASSTASSETDAMQVHPLHSPPAAEGFELELELEDSLVSVDAGLYILEDEINPWETCTEEPFIFSGETVAEEKVGFLCGGDDLATVFLDWLKRNKDSISPEDLRSIKLKRSTIECAARRLGGGKQGNVQLLKLILDWVQNHHLHMRRRRSRGSEAAGRNQDFYNHPSPPPLHTNHFPFPQEPTTYNPNINFYYESPPCNFYTGEPSFPAVMPCYRSETMPPHHYYQNQVFSAEPWQQGFAPAAAPPHLPVYYPGLMASATKEARKKRMARHRRSFSRQRYRNQQQRQNLQNLDTEESSSAHSINVDKDGSFFPAAAAAAAFPPATTQKQQESYLHRHSSSAGERRREGMKEEKNYRFLLQKVLKQSDVGSLGRIVLPKKEAEINLPELVTRDGISIEMEDIGTSRLYNMRYRFWPNNKSRMYLLENTGDFVRSNGLEEGDFIVLYCDVKCGKYMIRGVKVRQPMEMIKGGSNSNSGKAQPLL